VLFEMGFLRSMTLLCVAYKAVIPIPFPASYSTSYSVYNICNPLEVLRYIPVTKNVQIVFH
jgi:hypothetical protein